MNLEEEQYKCMQCNKILNQRFDETKYCDEDCRLTRRKRSREYHKEINEIPSENEMLNLMRSVKL